MSVSQGEISGTSTSQAPDSPSKTVDVSVGNLGLGLQSQIQSNLNQPLLEKTVTPTEKQPTGTGGSGLSFMPTSPCQLQERVESPTEQAHSQSASKRGHDAEAPLVLEDLTHNISRDIS